MSDRADLEYPSKPLVEAASHGDLAAVDSLLLRHLSGLYAFVRLNSGRLLRSKESHADLVQSTCREVLASLGETSWESEAHFKRWLYSAALNKIKKKLRYWRAEKRDALREARAPAASGSEGDPLDLVGLYGGSGTPSEQAIANEQVERVERVFAALPDEQRQVVTLIRIVGLPYSEVAEHLETSEANARKLYSRASARIIRLFREG